MRIYYLLQCYHSFFHRTSHCKEKAQKKHKKTVVFPFLDKKTVELRDFLWYSFGDGEGWERAFIFSKTQKGEAWA